ncbi:thioredoxin domain-containing protein 16 isoform X1 [Alligator mississippiensis]|uniref:thioredoxin domain-containing protein 16 isoform X1 n=1 Tax=Alligator mississippiensis TaxID=8496 RepID=UPI002877709D|nr:thioredoxin domain-containing protein 16 isoform X1 [Alligator mississippiensis]XP_019351385.2 thioredoxin domain-containing protein 16 isoform X1 [Alligator mississippiensis]XP_059579391.1 thioredoxin domain-containing protein 16 isoform X1 [Alligator mississippiensis]XP_059579392.1 thioredoxin domain-containing protein 16 isoform X1 [Alligator mississippiensis]
MSSKRNRWAPGFSFLLLCSCCMSSARNANALLELSPQEYFSSLRPGKASLVYFSHDVSPGVSPFLEQIESSVEPLQDYGISVVKVNCPKEDVSRYCGKQNTLLKAYLFRGNILLREFPTDALFNVNAIVANVLFALLFNEVKYIASPVDHQNLENSLKGRLNVVFAYVPAIGTAEHRAVMETAFVYGTAHQFILTTEVLLLKSVSTEDTDGLSAQLFFCHCKRVMDPTQPCRRTPMEQPLSTLNIHKYLKLMEAPIVTEVAADPEKVSTVHLQLGLPLVFILSQKETYEADRRTAEFVAWQLLGRAGVALLARDSLGLNVLLQSNVALKTAEEGVPIKYLVLEDTDEIIALVENKLKGEQFQEYEEEEDEEEKENSDKDVQDDQVVEAIHRDRKRELPLDLIRTLTEETFHGALTETGHTAVLFYTSWEAVSLATLQSYVEVAMELKGTSGVSLARVNCWDWPGVCAKQNVTQFPVVKIYEKGERPLTYSGMLGTEDLLRFIMLSRVSCPLKLASVAAVEGYLRGELLAELSPYHTTSVLGLFTPSMKEAREAFIEAGAILKGYITTGLYYGDDALVLSSKYNVPLPALLFARHEERSIDPVLLSRLTPQEIAQTIRYQLLETFPEITVENLPTYWSLGRPLLILFSDSDLGPRDRNEMLRLGRGSDREAFLACWLNLQRTPVGLGILKAYFSTPPPLPLLAWVNLHAGGEVFAFPPDQPVTQSNVLSWLEKCRAGLQLPSTTLSDAPWTPPLPAYNFLRMMESTLPEFTLHTAYGRGDPTGPRQAEAAEEKAPVREEQAEEPRAEAEKGPPPGRDLRGTVPRLVGRERHVKRHAEL